MNASKPRQSWPDSSVRAEPPCAGRSGSLKLSLELEGPATLRVEYEADWISCLVFEPFDGLGSLGQREDAADGCREVESSEVYESHQLGNVLRLRSVVPQDLVLVQDQGDAVGHGEGLAADADEYESAVGRQ